MQHTFISGNLGILVDYCEEHTRPDIGAGTEYDQVDAGARIDFRRVDQYEGANTREGTHGYRVLPVSEGGIWRIDLSSRIDMDVPEARYHHHPHFQNGDVGPRVIDDELSQDALGWIDRQLRDLPAVLVDRGFADVAASLDMEEFLRSLPVIRLAIETSMMPTAA